MDKKVNLKGFRKLFSVNINKHIKTKVSKPSNSVILPITLIQEIVSQYITALKRKGMSYGDIAKKVKPSRSTLCLFHKKRWIPQKKPYILPNLLKKLVFLTKK